MRRAFMPVLKNKVPLVVGDAVLGQDRLGLGMGLALLFGEFRHDFNPSCSKWRAAREARPCEIYSAASVNSPASSGP